MSFGKNPHVAKAEAAEQKAQVARDEAARKLAWREAARLWDRAAEREQNPARGQSYTERAEAARAAADGEPEVSGETAQEADDAAPEGPTASATGKARWLN